MIKKAIKEVGKEIKEILSVESKQTFEKKNKEFVNGKYRFMK